MKRSASPFAPRADRKGSVNKMEELNEMELGYILAIMNWIVIIGFELLDAVLDHIVKKKQKIHISITKGGE